MPSRLWPEAAAVIGISADYYVSQLTNSNRTPHADLIRVAQQGLATLAPSLPFFLEERGLSDSNTGVIVSVQFAAVILGHALWGPLCDRFGSRTTLMVTIGGDALFFGLTAIADSMSTLLVVRALAGFSTPVVPCYVYVFDRCPPADVPKAIGRMMGISVMCVACGTIVVATLYDSIHWEGVHLMAGGVAAASLPFVLCGPPPLTDGPKSKPEGVRRAIRQPLFISQVVTSLISGFMITTGFTLPVLLYKNRYGTTVTQTGLLFIVNAATNFVTSFYIVPPLCRRFGVQRTLGFCHVWLIAALCMLSFLCYQGVWPRMASPYSRPGCMRVQATVRCSAQAHSHTR